MAVVVTQTFYHQNIGQQGPPLIHPQYRDAFVLFYLKEGLAAAGWTVTSSSDGQGNVSFVGDVISSPLGGPFGATNQWQRSPGGMGNFDRSSVQPQYTGAAFTIVQPTIPGGSPGAPGGRKFMFARQTSGPSASGLVTYVRPDGVAATIPGFAFGDTVDSSTIDATQYNHYVVAETSPPYGWYSVVLAVSSSWVSGYCLFFDYVDGVLSLGQDPDPYVLGGFQSGAAMRAAGLSRDNAAASSSSDGAFAWYGVGTPSEQFAACVGGLWAHSATRQAVPGGMLLNPFNAAEECLPIFWTGNTQRSGLRHPKGFGRMLRWNGTFLNTPGGDTLASRTRWAVGDGNLPWDGSTDPGAISQSPFVT